MKILYVTTIGITMNFFKHFVKSMIEKGHTIDIATNTKLAPVSEDFSLMGCKIYDIDCSRSSIKKGNIRSIKQIRNIVKEGNYELVHCHTPIASICTRYACKKLRKDNIKVVYTAHGFHFFKGAPKKNWLLYYPIEKKCSKWTDALITINKEDYNLATKKFKAKKIVYIPGVGIDINKFKNTRVSCEEKKKELGLSPQSFIILSVGELNSNKNHKIVIDALAEINNPNYYYLIAGVGELSSFLTKYAKEKKVNLLLLGFRKDVNELYKMADIYVHPSYREGLPVSVMEALASGTTVLASDIRGCHDLINDNLFEPDDYNRLADLILNHKSNGVIDNRYSKEYINNEMEELYANI